MYLCTLPGADGEAEEGAVEWGGASLSGQESVRLVSFLKTASQVNHVLYMSVASVTHLQTKVERQSGLID